VKHIKIGEYDCYSLSDGTFRLDGGAMFGVVPKKLWGSFYPADEENRIRLGLTPLLVAGKGTVLLVEGGIGQAFQNSEKLHSQYSIEKADCLEESLSSAGFGADDITHVAYTHLHWDHAGTACKMNDAGSFVPRFKKARYLVQKGEWNTAISGDPATRASYLPATLRPVEDSGLLQAVDGDFQVNDDILLKLTGGHTKYHQVMMLQSGGQGLIFWGDLIPTSKHVHLPFIMAYDNYPLDTYAMKERLLEETCEENFISAFPHNIEPGFARIIREGRKYTAMAIP
jgi:glyoxylase-like metal-dependent hydrolase (beta-lactamase superfamily II)